MRARLESIARVESYLSGELSGTERTQFEADLLTDKLLQQLLTFQQDFQKAISRQALRAQIRSAAKQGGGGSSGLSGKMLLIGGIVVLAGIIAYALFGTQAPAEKQQPVTEQPAAISAPAAAVHSGDTMPLIAERTRETGYQRGNVTTIDRFPSTPEEKAKEWQPWIPFKRQYFNVDPAKGSTIEGKSGTVIIVPSNAFVDKNGAVVTAPVRFELIEAIEMADMLAYNLTTMSFGKVLSSGGMVHTEAFANGEKVEINPDRPLYIEIPTSRYNPDMMAWKGTTDGDRLNWEDPQPLRNFLATVSFDLLDFTPKGFADEVSAYLPFRGHATNSKALTDSLYYALGSPENISQLTATGITLSPTKRKPVDPDFKGAIGELTDSEGNLLKDIEIIFLVGDNINMSGEFSRENGRFPVDIYDRTPLQLQLVKPGYDTITTKKLTFTPEKVTRITADFRLNDAVTLTSSGTQSAEELLSCMIDPLSIRAIRTAGFSNTILATKAFEERVQLLHKLKNGQELFDLYVNNLSQNMFEIDQMAAARLTGTDKAVFEKLAAQKLTNVESNSIHSGQLTAYYKEKREEYRLENETAHNAYLAGTQAELNSLLEEVQALQTAAGSNGSGLSKSKAARFPKKGALNQVYATSWYSTGWMNIDSYVHTLEEGTPKNVTVDMGAGAVGRKIYQCLDLLKTIIPLNSENNTATAIFPDPSLSGSTDMSYTFCVGIDRQGGKIKYAEQRYNPYQTDRISLVWETISSDALYERLQALSPANEQLLGDLKKEETYIKELLRAREDRSAAQTKVNTLLDEFARESSIMQLLLKFINPCYIIPPEPKAPGPDKKPEKFEGQIFETT